MSIRINVGATFDARDIKAARRELDALEDQARGLNTTMGRVGRGMMNFGSSLATVGSVMTKAITVPIIGAATASVKMAATFQDTMSRITGLVGIAAEEVRGMESAVLALSGKTAKSPEELAQALFVVTSAGLRGQQALDALEVAAMAASAGLGETQDIARAVAGAINAYGSEALDAAKATDIVVATARAGNFATDQFASALGRVLPFANQAQASLEDVGGAVALLTRTNGNAAESITQIQALFRAFVVPSAQARTILEEIGLTTEELRESMGRRGLVATLRTLDSALGGNRELLGRLLSSTEAASAAFQILNADSNSLADTFGVVSNATGLTQEAFDVASSQSAFKFTAALNDLKIAGIELGIRLLPVVTDMVDGFRNLVDRFSDLSPKQQDMIIKMAAIVAVMGPLLTLIGGAIIAVGALTVAVGALSVSMVVATGGLVLLGAAIAGIAWKNATRDMDQYQANLRIANKMQRDAAIRTSAHAREFYALKDAQSEAAQAGRLAGQAARFAETGFSAYSKEAQAARRETEEIVDPLAGVIDALDGLGDAANGSSETEGGGGAGAKIVALSKSMRSFFQQLNETNVGISSASDLIAQFSREVLAAGNISQDTVKGAEALARAIRQDIDRALADANRRLQEATNRFDSFRDAIARGVRSGNTLSDAVSAQTTALDELSRAEEDYERAQVSGDKDRIAEALKALNAARRNQRTFLDFLQTGVTTAEGFAAQIDALREAGASMEVVQQIAELGARTGGRVAAELLAGGAAAIEQANRMVTAVENASRRAGQAAAQQFFGAGVDAARAMVRGIEATIPELQSVLDRIADAIARAMGVRPNVDITGQQGPFIPESAGLPTKPVDYSQYVFGGAAQVAAIRAMDLTNLSAQLSALGVPSMATGGIVSSATLALIGEAGPEAVVPLDRANGMGTTINISVTGAIDPEGTARQIRQILQDAERRTGVRL